MDLQEMGVDGQDNRETGGSTDDRIFFMMYPMSFLQHWYATYPPPQQDTTTTGSSVVSPSSVDVDVDMTGDNTSALTDPEEDCCLQLLYCCILSGRRHGQVL